MTSASPDSVSALADAYWRQRASVDALARVGGGRPPERLPSVRFDDVESYVADVRRFQLDLDGATAETAGATTVAAESLAAELAMEADLGVAYWGTPVVSGYQVSNVQAAVLGCPLNTGADVDRYLDLLDAVPEYLDEVRLAMAEQAARGLEVPQRAHESTAGYLATFAASGADNAAWPPVERATLAPLDLQRLVTGAERAVEAGLVPAAQRLLSALADQRRHAPHEIGLCRIQGGDDAYRALLRRSLTLPTDPDELHRQGLDAVDRITDQLLSGPLMPSRGRTVSDLHDALEAHPRMYETTAEGIGARLTAPMQHLDAVLDDWFPRTSHPYRITALAPQSPFDFGWYEAPTDAEPSGTYWFNGNRPHETRLVSFASIAFHELLPGHHLQAGLQVESTALHAYQRACGAFAGKCDGFAEGYAVYCEGIAEDMGLYGDPFDLVGAHLSQLFYAARVVVDTGLNARGWTCERAERYLAELVREPDDVISSQVTRYGWDIPGQAISYGVGAWWLRDLRERTRVRLGRNFDIRAFHTWLLGCGTPPLPILDLVVDQRCREIESGADVR